MKIAISGKGGVGKTTIMALLADQMRRAGKEVLLIDADPSPHMAQTIGIETEGRITPIAEMRDLLTERSNRMPGSSFFNLNPKVDDLVGRFMVEDGSIRLMVLGAIRTGDGGCACPENTVLRRLLTKLLLSPAQVVLLDMEAGVEHLGRGTIAGVDMLLVVTTPSQSSVRTSLKIKKLAEEVHIPIISFVGNLIKDVSDEQFLTDAVGEPLIASFADSTGVRNAERAGQMILSATVELEDAAAGLMNRVFDRVSQADLHQTIKRGKQDQ